MQAETQRARQAAADAEAAAAEAFAEAGPEGSPRQHRPDSASPQGLLDVGHSLLPMQSCSGWCLDFPQGLPWKVRMIVQAGVHTKAAGHHQLPTLMAA